MSLENGGTLVSISSTLYARDFCTNVVLAAFSTYMYLGKAAKTSYLYEKFVRRMLMKLAAGRLGTTGV